MHIIYSRFTIYILEILNSEDDLVQRIQEACNEMRQNPNQVSDAVNSLIRRCHKCIEVGGQHFEQLRFKGGDILSPRGMDTYLGRGILLGQVLEHEIQKISTLIRSN
ncbi:hypothetical protein NQ315_005355 [Exocentrus adspersus]|uniref:Uncharacterized protein n=1 Tax=Exocentrus adspersus TaxID=1586481 RepID=A0AAV8W3I9_9CUCU|nr:hypothetical protein NQ315_005355 [Exocentrus adspersus]